MKHLTRHYRAALDLGSHKICCWINHDDGRSHYMIGSGHVASRGIVSGQFNDLRALEESIVAALYEAEQQSHVQVRQAVVTLNSSFFVPENVTLELALTGGLVTDQHIQHLQSCITHPEYYPIHIVPRDFDVGLQKNMRHPQGALGSHLTGRFHVIWMHKGHFETLLACLKRCQIQPSAIVSSSYASSYSCLTSDEKDLGVILGEIGGSTTTFSFFFHGNLIDVLSIPLGGEHMTRDIARACDTSLQCAERLKILYGAAMLNLKDHHDMIEVPSIDAISQDNLRRLPRSFLIKTLQQRCEELFLALKTRIQHLPHINATHRLVLTGGCSQMPGLKELAQKTLNRSVRIALARLEPEGLAQPNEFSAVMGALLYKDYHANSLSTQRKQNFLSWFRRSYDTIMNHL